MNTRCRTIKGYVKIAMALGALGMTLSGAAMAQTASCLTHQEPSQFSRSLLLSGIACSFLPPLLFKLSQVEPGIYRITGAVNVVLSHWVDIGKPEQVVNTVFVLARW